MIIDHFLKRDLLLPLFKASSISLNSFVCEILFHIYYANVIFLIFHIKVKTNQCCLLYIAYNQKLSIS